MLPRAGSDLSPRADGAVFRLRLDSVRLVDARRAARAAVVRGEAVCGLHCRRRRHRLAAVSAPALISPVRRVWLWGPVVAYMGLIFYLSAQSYPPVPDEIPDWILHSVEYFGFAAVVFRAVSGGLPAAVTRTRVATSMAIVTTYAV